MWKLQQFHLLLTFICLFYTLNNFFVLHTMDNGDQNVPPDIQLYSCLSQLTTLDISSPSLQIPLTDITTQLDNFDKIFGDETRRIIYVETSGKAVLSARMVCTLESVSRVNPDLALIVVFIKPATILDLRENVALAHVLSHSPNIHLTTLDAGLILNNSIFTGIEKRFNRSVAPMQHVSDALRLYLLWKVGGIYMDLDMVFHKNLTHLLGKNFIFGATVQHLNNCFMGFKRGHPVLLQMMNHMMVYYVPENYGVGPSTVGQTLTAIYNKTEEQLLKMGQVDDIFLLPHYQVGPVVYGMWDFFFKETPNENYSPMMKTGIAFHFWNKLSYNKTVPLNSTCAYARIARDFCPRSFWSCDKVF